MNDQSDSDAPAGSGDASPSGTPWWVKAVGVAIALGVLLLMVVLHLTHTLGPRVHGG
jgi:hypothetical protein